MITIDKKKIDEMAKDARFTSEFPFLRSRRLEKGANKTCSRCPRKNKLLGGEEHYSRVMRDLAMMNASRISKLRALLGTTDKIQIFYMNDQKKIVRTIL